MALEVGAAGTAAQLRANQTRPDMRAHLGRISVPTLIISGAEDRLTPPAQGEALHRGIAGSNFFTLDGCGHLSPLERPAEVAALLAKFLNA